MKNILIKLTVINTLVGLYFGFIFYNAALWGISDDVDFSKVAWGHIALRQFIESLNYALWVALFCFALSWGVGYAFTRNGRQSIKWAAVLAVLTLSIIAISSVIGNIQFYIERPVGM